jgi:PAS domain S-box-containing protein
LSLQGKTRSLTDFNDGVFDEPASVTAIERAGFGIGIGYYRIIKHIAAFMAGQFHEALEWADGVAPVLESVSSMAIWGTFHFYHALTTAALYDQVSEEQRQKFMQILSGILDRLQFWAGNCPENFANRYALVAAEIARIENRDMEAMRLYEEAIASARENGFIQNEAVAWEVAARFYRQRGFDKISRTYLSEASGCYARWGADGKVRQLERSHPWLGQAGRREPATLPEYLDATSLARAHQAISSEMETDKLLGKMMQIVVENAGAQSGFLLFEQDGAMRIVAKGSVGVAEVKAPLPVEMDESDLVAHSVVRFVARTKESVVLDDASRHGEFANDPYIRREKTKSILCAPLLSLGRLIGVLYLENNLVTEAFTPERIQLMEMLLSQVAISLENARIYEALRASEVKYRRLVDTAIEGVLVMGRDGMTSFVNARMAEMLGYRAEEILGRPITDFMFEEDIPDHKRKMENRRQGMPEYYERRFRHQDGQTVWTHVSATPIFDSEHHFEGSFAMLTDITENKQAESRLNEQLHFLQQLLNSIPLPVYYKDLEGSYLGCNTAFKAFLGLPGEEIAGRTIHAVAPKERADKHREADLALLRNPGVLSYEVSDVYNDGKYRHVIFHKATFVDANGCVAGTVGTLVDITERKLAIEEIRRLNQELEQRVADRTAQLLAANGELEAFAYSVSHDLRAPLRHIEGFLELLQKRTAADLDEKSRHYMATILDATKRMGTLIDDLLYFSRMGRQEMTKTRVDLTALAQEVIREIEPETEGRTVRWLLAHIPVVMGDRSMLRIVLANLISNAVKFTRWREQAEIEIGSLSGRETETLVYVRDNGVGFDMNYSDKLFGVFQRLHREDEFEGTGIGLANVRRIINRHGGRTWAEGEVGHGATFWFSLPKPLRGV